MTYCVGVQVDEGLVFLSDSRTNAGVDHIATFRKMTFFDIPGERALVLLSAGNLATSQSITGLLRERVNSAKSSVVSARTMTDAARLVGDAVRDVYTRDAEALKQHGIEFNPRSSSAGRSVANRCACFTSIRPATSSRPRPTPATSRLASPSTANPSSTAW